MNVPENIKKLIIDNFFDSHITIGHLLKIINKEYNMSIEELYAFLDEYQEQNGARLYRIPSNTSKELKDFIYEQSIMGQPYYKIANSLRETGVRISPTKVKEICDEVFAEKKEQRPRPTYRTGIFAVVRESTIDRFKDEGMTLKEIKDHFSILGVDLEKPFKYYNDEKYGVYEMGNDYIYNFIYSAKKERKSYRRIVEELGEVGIETSYETIRKHSKKIYEERKEKIPQVLPKVKRIRKKKPTISGVYELRKNGLTYKEIQEIINAQNDTDYSYESIRQMCKHAFEERDEVEPKILRSYHIEKENINSEIYDLRKHGVSYREITEILNKKGVDIKEWTVAYRCQKMFEDKKEDNKSATRGRRVVIEPIDEVFYDLRMNGYTDGRIVEFFEKKGITYSRSFVKNRVEKIFDYKGEKIPKGIFRKTNFNNNKSVINEYVDSERLRNLVYKVAKEKKADKQRLKRFMKFVQETYSVKLDVDKIDKER